MFPPVKYRSPGKLILSGEHAVLYGAPALAMAVAYYTETRVEPLPKSNQLQLKAPDLQYMATFSWETLCQICQRIKTDHAAFLQGQLSIRAVLKKPIELLQFTLGSLLERMGIPTPNAGIRVASQSGIPLGCGMGSSAALIMSTLLSLSRLIGVNLTDHNLIQLGTAIESMQHGKSSGLDIHLALKGGALHYQAGQRRPFSLAPDLPLYLIQTGKPASSTGDCVVQAERVLRDKGIVRAFESVTESLGMAFEVGNLRQIQLGIQENHRLLYRLGVVPDRVAQLIQQIEQAGAAAKICGAGSVKGQAAGALLVIPTDVESMLSVVNTLGLTCHQITGDNNGTQQV